MKGFMQFIREQGVVGLAIGFILGGAVSKVVSAFVEDIINPLIGLALNKAPDLSTAVIKLNETSSLKIGDMISVLIDFIIIAGVIYFIFKGLRLDKMDKKAE